MPKNNIKGSGTKADPWLLKTPSSSMEFHAYRDETADPPALMIEVPWVEGGYLLRALDDLCTMLKQHGDWMPLGTANEQVPVAEGTVEAWARSPKNPVGGWYGLKEGMRGRFGDFVPPVMEALGLAEVEHKAKNNRMRAL